MKILIIFILFFINSCSMQQFKGHNIKKNQPKNPGDKLLIKSFLENKGQDRNNYIITSNKLNVAFNMVNIAFKNKANPNLVFVDSGDKNLDGKFILSFFIASSNNFLKVFIKNGFNIFLEDDSKFNFFQLLVNLSKFKELEFCLQNIGQNHAPDIIRKNFHYLSSKEGINIMHLCALNKNSIELAKFIFTYNPELIKSKTRQSLTCYDLVKKNNKTDFLEKFLNRYEEKYYFIVKSFIGNDKFPLEILELICNYYS